MYSKLPGLNDLKSFAYNSMYEIEIKKPFVFESKLESFPDEDVLSVYKVNSEKLGEVEMLYKMVFDDFKCVFVLNKNAEDCAQKIKNNGKYNKFDFSKDFRRFMAKTILKKFGERHADAYVEDFLETDMGNNPEYKDLMTIVYQFSDNKTMKKFIKEL